MARWRQIQVGPASASGARLLHFADIANADEWFRQAQRFSAASARAAMDRQPFERQYAYAVEAMQALGNGYRAANVPPLSDPMWRFTWCRWWGVTSSAPQPTNFVQGLFEGRAVDPVGLAQGMGPAMASPAAAIRPAGYEGPLTGVAYDRVRQLWRTMGKPDLGARGVAMLLPRLTLTADPWSTPSRSGLVAVGFCDGPNGGVFDRASEYRERSDAYCGGTGGITGLFTGCMQWGGTREGCETYTWRSARWNDSPDVFGFLAAAGPRAWAINTFSAPLVWAVEMVAEIAERCVARGAGGVIESAYAFAIAKNLATAEALGHPPSSLGLTPELAAQARNVTSAVTAAAWSPDRWNQALAPHGAAEVMAYTGASLIAAANPIGVAVLGVARLALELVPRAVGTPPADEFGRATPVLEPLMIGGDHVSEEPRFDVPEAPGIDRSQETRDAIRDTIGGIVFLPRSPDVAALATALVNDSGGAQAWCKLASDAQDEAAKNWLVARNETRVPFTALVPAANRACERASDGGGGGGGGTSQGTPASTGPSAGMIALGAAAVLGAGYVATRPGMPLAGLVGNRSNPDGDEGGLSTGAKVGLAAAVALAGVAVVALPGVANAATRRPASGPRTPPVPVSTAPAVVAATNELASLEAAARDAAAAAEAARARVAAAQRDADAAAQRAAAALASGVSATAKDAARAAADLAAQAATRAANEAAARQTAAANAQTAAAAAKTRVQTAAATERQAGATTAPATVPTATATSTPAPSPTTDVASRLAAIARAVTSDAAVALGFYFQATMYSYGYTTAIPATWTPDQRDAAIRNLERSAGVTATGRFNGVETVWLLVEDIRAWLPTVSAGVYPYRVPFPLPRAAIDAANAAGRQANPMALPLAVSASG